MADLRQLLKVLDETIDSIHSEFSGEQNLSASIVPLLDEDWGWMLSLSTTANGKAVSGLTVTSGRPAVLSVVLRAWRSF